MASVWIEDHPNKNGKVYVLRWEIVRDGVRDRGARTIGPSKALAIKAKEKKLLEFHHHAAGVPLPQDAIPWPDFAARYLDHCEKHKAPRTFQNFDRPAITHFSAFIGRRFLGSITTEDVAGWETALMGEFGINSVRMKLISLRTAFYNAKREGLIDRLPTFHLPKAVKAGRVFTDDEVRQIIDLAPGWLRPLIVFFLHTGLRRGEALSLDWSRVRRAAGGHLEAEIGGVGGPRTKTGRSRVVPLHPVAAAAMGAPQPAGRVFPFYVNSVNHALGDIAAKTENLPRIRAHDFRHTWATRYMQATGDLFGLMALGGWTSINSVAQYQHLTRSRVESVQAVKYEGLPAVLPNISPKIGGLRVKLPSKDTQKAHA